MILRELNPANSEGQYAKRDSIGSNIPDGVRLALKVLLVGVVCYVSNQIGFANKIPPHNISALWPTIAILFAVLVASPPRHWWLYILAAYGSSVFEDARAGFPVPARWFVAAGIIEVLVAAYGVRRFAGGVRCFDSVNNLVAYIAIAVVIAPLVGSFIAGEASASGEYWSYWRVWLLSDSLAYLTVAPVILTWMNEGAFREAVFLVRGVEVALIVLGLVAVWVTIFFWAPSSETNAPTLVYLQLPFALWAAVRLGPPGSSAAILVITTLSIAGAAQGFGPFVASGAGSNVLALQAFLFVSSLPMMFLATIVAERKQAEAEAALQRREVSHLMRVSMLGGLSASIAHEINQPLGAIRANAEAALQMLAQEPSAISAKIGEALNDIVAEDDRAATVIRRLRSLLQKGERKSETIDIEEVLGSSVEMLHGELVARRIKVSAVPAGARLSVLGDPIQIQQVVLNLLVNAMDAMESTAVDQRVISISSGVNSDDMVQVEIRDRGVGIRAEDENRLFEPFFTRKDHGLGLGLAICSTIMQAHGGSLRLANDDSGGAVATLLLPTHQRAFR